jgi:hypothetical protein
MHLFSLLKVYFDLVETITTFNNASDSLITTLIARITLRGALISVIL